MTTVPINQIHYWDTSILESAPEPSTWTTLWHSNFQRKFSRIRLTLNFHMLNSQESCIQYLIGWEENKKNSLFYSFSYISIFKRCKRLCFNNELIENKFQQNSQHRQDHNIPTTLAQWNITIKRPILLWARERERDFSKTASN